jgi:cell wall-associated NlpC family hydrolase
MDLRGILERAGFKGQALNVAYAVAMAESEGRAKAFNGNRKTGDQSYGIFQINMLGKKGPERRQQFGLSSNDDLFDPVLNAQIAFKMSKGGTDWSPWSTFKRGEHRKHLGGSGAQVSDAEGVPGQAPGVVAPPEPPAPIDIISGTPSSQVNLASGQLKSPFSAAPKQDPAAPAQPGIAPASGSPGARSGGWGNTTSFRDKVIAAAMSQLGVPYSWGGGSKKGPSVGFGKGAGIRGFDCSSLVMYAFAQAGFSMPRTGRPQLRQGRRVPLSELKPGDFLGWGDGHHIALYLGNGKYIHAPTTGRNVEIKTLGKGSSAWGVSLTLPGDRRG